MVVIDRPLIVITSLLASLAMEIEFYRADARKLWQHMQQEEKLLRKKRRWLMGLHYRSHRNVFHDASHPDHEKIMLIILVSSEKVSISIGRAFKAFTSKQGGHHVVKDYVQYFSTDAIYNGDIFPSTILEVVYSAVDDLNNNGLCILADFATGNTIEFERTRPRLKKVIKEHLPSALRTFNRGDWMVVLKKLFMDPHNFHDSHLTLVASVSPPLLCAAAKILERLDKMSLCSLNAMYRRLKSTSVGPQLQHVHSGWCKGRLITRIQKICNGCLSRVHEGVEFPEPLAKALAVAGLSLKEIGGVADFPIPEFFHFSPEIEVLQNDILKALRSLPKIKYDKLKDLQPILDPKIGIPKKAFRQNLQRYLTEYLFECSEIDIPNPLVKTISLINGTSRQQMGVCFSKEKMEEELECVLDLSSQLRQMIWEFHEVQNVDLEFADAYIDDLENDSDGVELDGDEIHSSLENFNSQHCEDASFRQADRQHHSNAECVGESWEPTSNFAEGPDTEHVSEPTSNYQHDFAFSNGMEHPSRDCFQTWLRNGDSKSKNQYLAIQDICDDMSLVAYNVIGRLLEEFLERDGVVVETSIASYLRGGVSDTADYQEAQTSLKDGMGVTLVQVVKEQMPSLPERYMFFHSNRQTDRIDGTIIEFTSTAYTWASTCALVVCLCEALRTRFPLRKDQCLCNDPEVVSRSNPFWLPFGGGYVDENGVQSKAEMHMGLLGLALGSMVSQMTWA
ncbi:hypothetical protein ACLOJK_008948 [Asimina triloba]